MLHDAPDAPIGSDASLSAREHDERAPMHTTTHEEATTTPQRIARIAERERLPEERASVTRVFRLRYSHKDGTPDVMQLYFTAGLYSDGRVGEIFLKADKPGTLASGALDAVGIMASMLLQYGVPLPAVISKLRNTRFSPAGFTGAEDVPNCHSPLDLLARWLEMKFMEKTDG